MTRADSVSQTRSSCWKLLGSGSSGVFRVLGQAPVCHRWMVNGLAMESMEPMDSWLALGTGLRLCAVQQQPCALAAPVGDSMDE